MKKVITQFVIVAAVVSVVLLLVSRVDWMKVLKVEKATKTTEEKLGKLTWDQINLTETEIHSRAVSSAVDTLISHICGANSIDATRIRVHIIKKDEINAFALPDNQLIIYSKLIEDSQNENELAGVMAHEIAHMEKHHVMQKLVKEMGLAAIISIASGNNTGAIQQIVRMLSSTAYDRKMESEADMTGVDYLIKADMDPEPFANFLYRLGDEQGNIPAPVYWISDHPESKARAEAIIDYIRGKDLKKIGVLSQKQWDDMQDKLKDWK